MSAPPFSRKRFGQHFLHDPEIIRRIIAAIQPQPQQHLVEIGPGRGALTKPLLARCRQLDAIELDRDLIAQLQQDIGAAGQLNLYQGDVLDFDWADLRRDERRLRIVGNLPYNISTPLLFRLLAAAEHIDDMHFMLQKEVAQRLAAGPGDSDYGRLSIMVQYYCAVALLFPVGAGAFTPPPKVESAVVSLQPYRQRPVRVNDEQRFATLVGRAFSQRRKTLRNSLKSLLSAAAIEAAGIDPNLRPERLSLSDFAALSNSHDHSVSLR
jgi:16S rRNA (adenine1518-N6/adenine1519-N6)-dimethyltransferase